MNTSHSTTTLRRRHTSSGSEPTAKEREYLEVIYYLASRNEPVIAARLARWMKVQPPTVTHIVSRLLEKGLIERNAHGEITLTATGFQLAEAMVRRHRILERFLVDVMGLPWHLIHEEAVRLEHTLSPVMEERIMALVGHATTCPHGNPIPGQNEVYTGNTRMDTVQPGQQFRIRRIAEEAEEETPIVSFLEANGLVPGAIFTVADNTAAIGVTLQRPGLSITVPAHIAEMIWGDVETSAQ
ncbi:MAG TPA: metal-dependent transcriptional regulator [Chloroflexus aurantiacus]|uniref:metal-dependent transcriptional regulator n=1 Tax=Chloroflexus aurantiacus TaxID=1108 RepID=UPI000E84DBB7|nr:metal-dependent transcriptional regulator [Chloroflexus aurantiacus]